jgi:outer membrane immunogenic protein
MRYCSIDKRKDAARGTVMKKLLFGIAAIAALVGTPALAADLALKAPPPPPAWNWTGFYGGIEGGAGWGTSRQTDTSGVTSGDYSQSGGLIGGTFGYNWQMNHLVFGLEADLSWTGIDGSVSVPGKCTAGGGTMCFTNMQWLNTDRARLGFAWDRYLVYVTGGLAGASINDGQLSCSTPIAGASCGTQTEWGGTIGGGLEAYLAPKWSVKLEYLYADFGTIKSYTVVIPVSVSERINILRAGINYHF